jgi:hypothetical protein
MVVLGLALVRRYEPVPPPTARPAVPRQRQPVDVDPYPLPVQRD